jgi:protein-disulfide isomerase
MNMEETIQSQQLTKKERRELKKQRKLEARKKQERQKRIKKISLWSVILLGVVAVIFAFKLSGGSSSDQPTLSVDAVATTDQTKGNSESKVLLVEYSDFQCPACGRYYPLLKQLNQELGDKIQFVYRHFPLRQAHRNAEPAAFAAEAAGRQGKFWEMHDLIFEGQKNWSEKGNAKKTFIEYAESLNLDIDKFKTDMGSKEIKNKVRNDYSSGIKAGVNSTPTLFLNGEKLQNPRDYEALKKLVEESLGQ